MFRSYTPRSGRYTTLRRRTSRYQPTRSRSRRGAGYAAGQNAGTSFQQIRLEDTVSITLSPVAGQARNWGGKTINLYKYLAESDMFRTLAKLYDQVRITGATVWVNQLSSGVQTASNTASQLVCSWDRNSTGYTMVPDTDGNTRQLYIDPKPPAAQGYQSSTNLPLGNLDSPKRYRFFIDARTTQELTTYLSTEDLVNRADSYTLPSLSYNQWNPSLILGVDLRGVDPGNVLKSNFKLEISISTYLRGFRFDPTIGGNVSPEPVNQKIWQFCMPVADLGEYLNGDRRFPVPPARRYLKSILPAVGKVGGDFPYIPYQISMASHAMAILPDPYTYTEGDAEIRVTKANTEICFLYFNEYRDFDWSDWYLRPDEVNALGDYLLINDQYTEAQPIATFPIFGSVATIDGLTNFMNQKALSRPSESISLNGLCLSGPNEATNKLVYLKSLVGGLPTGDEFETVGEDVQSLLIDGSRMAGLSTTTNNGIIDVEAVVDCTAAPDTDSGPFQDPLYSQGMAIINTTNFNGSTATTQEIVAANEACTGPKWQTTSVQSTNLKVITKKRNFPTNNRSATDPSSDISVRYLVQNAENGLLSKYIPDTSQFTYIPGYEQQGNNPVYFNVTQDGLLDSHFLFSAPPIDQMKQWFDELGKQEGASTTDQVMSKISFSTIYDQSSPWHQFRVSNTIYDGYQHVPFVGPSWTKSILKQCQFLQLEFVVASSPDTGEGNDSPAYTNQIYTQYVTGDAPLEGDTVNIVSITFFVTPLLINGSRAAFYIVPGFSFEVQGDDYGDQEGVYYSTETMVAAVELALREQVQWTIPVFNSSNSSAPFARLAASWPLFTMLNYVWGKEFNVTNLESIFEIDMQVFSASKVWQRIKGFFKKAVSVVGKVLPIVKQVAPSVLPGPVGAAVAGVSSAVESVITGINAIAVSNAKSLGASDAGDVFTLIPEYRIVANPAIDGPGGIIPVTEGDDWVSGDPVEIPVGAESNAAASCKLNLPLTGADDTHYIQHRMRIKFRKTGDLAALRNYKALLTVGTAQNFVEPTGELVDPDWEGSNVE